MHVFDAEIPPAEAHRSEVVEVRVARKVATMFGLGADLPPFHRSWVCDYTALSLAEIGRGAPHPERSARGGESRDGEWSWSGRAVWSPPQSLLPGGLSNATLNRYGPDTKAAAVLSSANRLLRDTTAAVRAAAEWMAATGCDPEVRLAVWAGLVIEAYRAQPALVVAAVQARQVQRSLSAHWGAQVDRGRVAGGSVPAEIHSAGIRESDGPRWRPTTFDLVDTTLPALRLADDAGGPIPGDSLGDVASAWCHRLLAIGRAGRGVVWLAEDPDGSRRAHAMVRVGAVVAPFVAATLGDGSGADPQARAASPVLPGLPPPEAMARTPVRHRRAHLIAAHIAANYVRYRDELLLTWPGLRGQTRALVAEAAERAAQVLSERDPATVQLRAYDAYLRVWDRRGTPDADPRRLMASQDEVIAAWRAGRLDPGAAAYLLELGVVALGDAAPDRAVTRAWWSAILEARGMDPDADPAETPATIGDAQLFHLHHYAAWLAAGGRRTDLRRALALQERVAEVRDAVVRREPTGFVAKSAAARAGHELAAGIATDLALATPDREQHARRDALTTAVRHTRAVLADPTTRALLLPSGRQPAGVRAARACVRALAEAATHGVPVDPVDAAAAITLLDAVGGEENDIGRATLARLARTEAHRG